MPTRRSFARGSARIVTGLVGIAVAGAAITAATVPTLPSISVPPPSTKVTPIATDQQRVCPGPILELAADAADATSASAFGSPTTVSAGSIGRVQSRDLTAGDDTKAGAYGGPVALTLPAPDAAEAPPLLAGAQSQTATQDDLAGLAAAGCGEATRSSWLAAGSTDLGQTSLVLLSNPTAVQASVNLTVFGESGPIEAPGAQGILVDPGSQRVIALAGIAPNVKAPVVHVESKGGTVLATMQQSVVRGLDPGGVELASATTPPSDHQVISGLTVSGAGASGATGTEGYADTVPAVRLVVPGDKPASVRIGVVAEKGTTVGTSASATLQPKTVQEIPLDHLINGSFTVTIDSDQPVIVGARTSTSGPNGADFAWFAASRPLTGTTMVPVSAGPGATIHLANRTDKDASVVVTGASGTAQNVAVPAESSVPVTVASAGAYTVSGAAGLSVSVSLAGGGLSSSYPVAPPDALASPVTVYPR